jgi:hypothetical protein
MAKVPVDHRVVDSCREIASSIADDVQRFIGAHTTVGVERTTARAYGVEGLDDQGTPLVNVLVDRCQAQGHLAHGIALFLGQALISGAQTINDAAERLAYGRDWGAVPTDVSGAKHALASYTREISAGANAAQIRHRRDGQYLRRRAAGQGRRICRRGHRGRHPRHGTVAARFRSAWADHRRVRRHIRDAGKLPHRAARHRRSER